MSSQLSPLESAGTESRSVIDAQKRPRVCGHSQRLPVGDALRRARALDPVTSHEAAEGASAFAGSHADRIERALKAVANATPHELTAPTRLTVVQIDRRLPELERAGRARVVRDAAGDVVQRGAARVWEAVR